jgi:OPT family small oligopeptide transporter
VYCCCSRFFHRHLKQNYSLWDIYCCQIQICSWVVCDRALHEKEDSKGIHRLHFFTIAAICSFTWYILPGYMFATISALSWICWTWKDSIFAHQLGSGLTGLGLTAFSFDWATISAILSSPLATPWSTLVNVYIGFLVAAYIITPLLYWGDLFHTKRFPIITNKLFLSNGHRYNVSEVVAGDGLTLDLQKYETYGAPHMSAFYAVLHWGLMFAALGATIVHVMLWHGKAIYRQYKTNPMEHKQSIHTKLMQKYKDVPSWWFWAFIIGNALIAMVIMQTWKDIFQLPWWGVLLSMFLNMFFTLPIGVLAATTNRFTGIGPLCDILTGYMFPGYPMANVFFRMYSAESIVQGLAYLRCSKLGHYMKIPPRELFTVLVCGAVLAGLVNLACAYWLFEGVGNMCVESGAWSCPVTANTFSVITLWGLVGSSRLLGATGEYRNLRWFFLLGALAPIPFWVIAKTSSKLKVYAKAANFPLLFGAASQWPPATPVTYNSWFITGYIFNHLLFKHRRRWWQRYNYILSAGLDTGVAFAGPLIFLTLLYFGKSGPTWWGNPTHYLDHCPLSYCPTAKGINVTAQYHFCPVH